MIDSTVLSRTAEIRSEFENATPFPHAVIDDFFELELAEKLLSDFPPFAPANAKNEFGEVGRKATVPDIGKISPFYAEVDHYIRSREFLDTISRVTGIKDLLPDEKMFGGGTHENLEGQELDPHVDFNYLEDRKLHRRLNALLYLNKEWGVEWGGCLELHSNPRRPLDNQIKIVQPVFNRCVIFETSERSWHGFERIRLPEDRKHLSRKMLSIYLYTRDRPAEQIAPPHSTFYVQRPLPEYIEPGRALTEKQVRTVEELLGCRDRWIEHYQEKELEFSRRLHGGVSLEQAQAAAARPVQRMKSWIAGGSRKDRAAETAIPSQPEPQVPVAGYGMREGAISGLFDDGWAGNGFEMSIRIQKPCERIEIEGFLPEQAPEKIPVRISVNGSVVLEEKISRGNLSLRVPAQVRAGELVKLGIASDAPYCPMRRATAPMAGNWFLLLCGFVFRERLPRSKGQSATVFAARPEDYPDCF